MRLVAFVVAMQLCWTGLAESVRTKDIELEYRESGGASIAFAGVPLIRGSSIQLHSPGWKQGYYSSTHSPRKIEVDQRARTVTVRHRLEKGVKFTATETWRFLDDRRIELLVQGQLDSDVAAELEWTIGYINAFALYGGSYSSGIGEATPVHPEPSGVHGDPTVLEGARAVTLQSRVGTVLCSMTAGPGLSLLDGRRVPGRWWAREKPSYWLGCLNMKITRGEPFEARAIIRFDPAALRQSALPLSAKAVVTRLDNAYEPPFQGMRIIPKPRRLEQRAGDYLLDGMRVSVATPLAQAATGLLARELKRRFDIDLPPLNGDAAAAAIRLRPASTGQIKPEGYSLRCDDTGIEIQAGDAAGFRYAVQSLLQLARYDRASGGARVPGCAIDDEPSLAFRGVHLFPGRDSLEFHRKLVENVIARFKFNHVVLECEYTQWDGDRGIWVDISVPKAQIAAYVTMLRDNGLEPIPLVQSLGHSGWMFKNGRNLDIAEDPGTPAAYDATNAKTYEFIDRIYDEAVALFKPKYFHIGHDEVTLFGKYPNREESKKWGVSKLFLSDVGRWIAFFKPRKIQIMMWGDMLLARDEIKDGAASAENAPEALARRERLPKDIIICDWHYDALKPDEYPSLKIFRDAGFKTIASTWFNPMNIYGFAEAARRQGAWGLLQTTWAGYNLDEGVLDRDLKQFAAYILAAEYAWSASSPPPDELPWRADQVLIESLDPHRARLGPRAGFTVDLAGITRGESLEFPVLPPPDARHAGFAFQEAEAGAVVLDGALLPQNSAAPPAATLELRETVASLAFLHATLYPADPGQPVGAYHVRYDDGSVETIALNYGINIRSWDDPAIARQAPGGWMGKSESGLPAALRVFVWTNPHPERTIRNITFSTDHQYASPALFGLSGIAVER